MAEHAENKIKTYFLLLNLPDTFQLTAKMNFQKYDFQRSRIFLPRTEIRTIAKVRVLKHIHLFHSQIHRICMKHSISAF